MSREVEESIKVLMSKIAEREAEVANDKRRVNQLSRRLGREEPYVLDGPVSPGRAEPHGPAVGRRTSVVRMDQFAHEPTTQAAVHAFLRWRGPAAGPQSFRAIFDGLTYGGFRFGGGDLDRRRDTLRRALRNDPGINQVDGDFYELIPKARPRRSQQSVRRQAS